MRFLSYYFIICLCFFYLIVSNLLRAQLISPTASGKFMEVFQYTTTNPTGSPRANALGGAFTALGGDISSVTNNPAGLGFYRRSEYNIGLNTGFFKSKANVRNLSSVINTDYSKQWLNINNLGLVMESNRDLNNGFYGGAWAVSYQRLSNFHSAFQYYGNNQNNSIRDAYLEEVQGVIPVIELDEGVAIVSNEAQTAYDAYVINVVEGGISDASTDYYTLNPDASVSQLAIIQKSGGLSELSLSYGGNFGDELYFGFSANYLTVNHEEKKTYVEAIDDISDSLLSFQVEDRLITEGNGLSFRTGLIYNLANNFKLGLTFESPKWLSLSESQITRITAEFDETNTGFTIEDVERMSGTFSYKLMTPMTFRFGGAYFFGKKGFITSDIEFVDYPNAKLKASTFDFFADNNTISNLYKGVVNYKIGGEYRIKQLMLRAGFARFNDPFRNTNEIIIDHSKTFITGGIGFKNRKHAYGFSFQHYSYKTQYQAYTLANELTPFLSAKHSGFTLQLNASFYY